jgi:hypothetical protein
VKANGVDSGLITPLNGLLALGSGLKENSKKDLNPKAKAV